MSSAECEAEVRSETGAVGGGIVFCRDCSGDTDLSFRPLVSFRVQRLSAGGFSRGCVLFTVATLAICRLATPFFCPIELRSTSFIYFLFFYLKAVVAG